MTIEKLSDAALSKLDELVNRTSVEHVIAKFQISKATFYRIKKGYRANQALIDRLERLLSQNRVIMRPILTTEKINRIQQAIEAASLSIFDQKSGCSKTARIRALQGRSVTSTTIHKLMTAADEILQDHSYPTDSQEKAFDVCTDDEAKSLRKPASTPDNDDEAKSLRKPASTPDNDTPEVSLRLLSKLALLSLQEGRGASEILVDALEYYWNAMENTANRDFLAKLLAAKL